MPPNTSVGHDITRQSLVRLNRVRTGCGRFKHNTNQVWLTPSASCECDAASQNAHHITSECPIPRFKGDIDNTQSVSQLRLWWTANNSPPTLLPATLWAFLPVRPYHRHREGKGMCPDVATPCVKDTENGVARQFYSYVIALWCPFPLTLKIGTMTLCLLSSFSCNHIFCTRSNDLKNPYVHFNLPPNFRYFHLYYHFVAMRSAVYLWRSMFYVTVYAVQIKYFIAN